jgi:zinc/manganese transport system permease protein
MKWLVEPGFFQSSQVHIALIIGGVVAVVSAVVGVFTVMRGQSFAGHALTDASATGGSGSLLIGINPLLGFVFGAVAGAGAMEAIGVRHRRGRDLATGIVLGAAIGLASLFLYLTTSSSATTGTTQQILFGSIFATSSSTVPVVVLFSVLSVGVVAVFYRPLLMTSVNNDLAAAKGIPIRLVGLAYMLALALAVGLSSLTIGAILSTALLVGPAAAALRLTKRIGRALLVACLIGLATTWFGVLLAYDSADWGGGHDALPVSFFIVGLIFSVYLISGVVAQLTGSGRVVAVETSRGAPTPRRRGASRPTSQERACSPGS